MVLINKSFTPEEIAKTYGDDKSLTINNFQNSNNFLPMGIELKITGNIIPLKFSVKGQLDPTTGEDLIKEYFTIEVLDTDGRSYSIPTRHFISSENREYINKFKDYDQSSWSNILEIAKSLKNVTLKYTSDYELVTKSFTSTIKILEIVSSKKKKIQPKIEEDEDE